ncbi:cobalt-precorrin 5A hydrolase [Heliorestis acidaminivorans]|uniref:Cobalt-precorrin 5A hydrolase n=1 Tax=Heliorestis acidaminivorans TaxID=553427 RepID=A0A6I0F5B1_9FIRM|nr:cobalt-precorrin 5A hydrolase [Heliorestis acidaminivorans]KAB2954182.1 cobalt-precorrin 5A hydrolase [Heliorestis acidaminivorans]
MNIIALTPGGTALAGKISNHFPHSTIWLPEDLQDKKPEGLEALCKHWQKPLREDFQKIYRQGQPLLFIGALAILVRFLAPLIEDKQTDPPVLALDEEGQYVISVLSGHWGGANELAHKVAQAIQARPVITTATDVKKLPAIDTFARRFNAHLEPREGIKKISSSLLRQQPLQWYMEEKFLKNWKSYLLAEQSNHEEEPQTPLPPETLIAWQSWPKDKWKQSDNCQEGTLTVLCTTARVKEQVTLTLYPRYIVAGIGCRRGVSLEKVEKALEQAFESAKISEHCLLAIASGWIKATENALLELAQSRQVPFITFTADEINDCCQQHQEISTSTFVYQSIGVKALCEPTALLVHPNSQIIQSKRKYGPVTVALAEVPWPLLDLDQLVKRK